MLNLCNRTRFLRLADDRDRLRSVIGLKLGLKTNFKRLWWDLPSARTLQYRNVIRVVFFFLSVCVTRLEKHVKKSGKRNARNLYRQSEEAHNTRIVHYRDVETYQNKTHDEIFFVFYTKSVGKNQFWTKISRILSPRYSCVWRLATSVRFSSSRKCFKGHLCVRVFDIKTPPPPCYYSLMV